MPYVGNKRNEYNDFIKNVNIDKYTNIIEPFCGSSAISFNIWLNDKDKNKIYYLNDIDNELIDIYNLIKIDTPDNILNEINKIRQLITDKEIFNTEFKKPNKTFYEKLFFKKYYCIRPGTYPLDNRLPIFSFTKKQLLFFEFIKSDNVFITNDDWSILFDKFKDDKDTLIIFDPPYINSCNAFYNLANKINNNIYEYFYNNNINSFNCKIFFILEDIWIIRLLFKNNINNTYFKQYNSTKKNTNHIVISNHKDST